MANRLNRATLLAMIITLLCALTVALASMSGLSVSAAPTASDLTTSTKSVDKAEALNSDTLVYTIVISNSGNTTASPVNMTDTLPTGLTYVANSFTLVDSASVISDSAGVIGQQATWSGQIGAGGYAEFELKATIGAGVAISTMLTNSVALNDGTSLLARIAATQVVSQTDQFIYLPVIFKPLLPPVINAGSVSADGSNAYKWTISWAQVDTGGTYEIQESNDSDFSNIISTQTVSGLSKQYSHAPSPFNQYFYRARYKISGSTSPWSNVVNTVGAYRDIFDNNSTGWIKVRQDLDDTQNELRYLSQGWLKMHVRGRWDYFIASSLQPTPAGNYAIESRVKLEGTGNLNSYGFVLGADWNGDTCPTLIPHPNPLRDAASPELVLNPNEQEESPLFAPDPETPARADEKIIDNCFNHYYRISMIWKGHPTEYKLQVKRIDYHESPKNQGRGHTLFFSEGIPISDQDGWNSWRVEVRRDTGEFKLFSGTTEVATWTDSTYINEVNWGFWASSDEYLGSDPLYEYITVKPLP